LCASAPRAPAHSHAPLTRAGSAYRMIICLFHIFASAGYQWIAQVDVAHPMRPPRQVFAGKVPDSRAHFFIITFSRAGHKLTLVDPPPAVGDTLAVSIRTAFKGQITSDYGLEPGVHVIEFKRNVFGSACPDAPVRGNNRLTSGQHPRRRRR
jgi:hypothetical protein